MKNDTHQLTDVSMGKKAPDLLVLNAKVVNVYTGEILNGYSIGTSGERIAFVEPFKDHKIGEQTVVIDADGQTVIPGFIDGHTHVAWISTPYEFIRHAAIGGTTTIVTETMEIYPVAGIEGVLEFLESLKDQPIRFYATAPAMTSTSPDHMGVSIDDLEILLSREDVIGLGESYWQVVLQHPDVFIPLFQKTLGQRKTLEGHTAGARGKKLMAYAACGISSCHEPITADEVIDRLRLGIHVMIREGSIRRDLETIATIRERGLDTRRLILASDGITPEDLLEKGYMEYIVQKAVHCGFDPVTAIQMATINVAEHFGLDADIGGIAPGKCADFLLIPDPGTIEANCVVCKGRVVARNGKLAAMPRKHVYSSRSRNRVHLGGKLCAEDFSVQAPTGATRVDVRVMELVTDLVTKETRATLPVVSGKIRSDPDQDILKVCAVDRAKSPGTIFTGFLKGLGLSAGAFGCSAGWDTSCIIVAGSDDNDMALCINRIRELEGGVVLCSKGKVLSEMALPLFGLLSEKTIPEIAVEIRKITDSAKELGVPFRDPILTLVTLSGAAIPFLRICEKGYVDLKAGKPSKIVTIHSLPGFGSGI